MAVDRSSMAASRRRLRPGLQEYLAPRPVQSQPAPNPRDRRSAAACLPVTRVDPIRPDDRKHHLALAELVFQYRLEFQPRPQAVNVNEDVALAERIVEILRDVQRVRGAVIPPVIDKDFSRHGRIMAFTLRKNRPPARCVDLKIRNYFSDDFPEFRGDFSERRRRVSRAGDRF